MALTILYTKISGTLTANISSATTLIPVDAATLSIIQSNLTSGNWTYLTLDNGIYQEEIKVTGVSTTYLIVQRAQSGSVAQSFSSTNTTIYERFGAQAILDLMSENPATANVAVAASGIATATSAVSGSTTTYTVSVTAPNFTTDTNIEITGIWPNLAFSFVGNSDGCCTTTTSGSSTGVTSLIINSPILTGNITGSVLTLGLVGPTFTGAGGIVVSGSWSSGFTITGSGGGGTGTVQQVFVGTGLSLSGTPTVNPTISLSNTGVAAGVYGDMTFNAQGQLTNITSGFAPVGHIALVNGGSITQVGSSYSITLNQAAVGVYGIVELADSTATFNPNDDSTVTTPKVVAKAIGALSTTITGGGSSAGEATSSYTNTISSTATSLTIASGQTALLIGEVEVLDTSSATVPPQFGVAIIATGGTALYASRITPTGKQCIVCLITAVTSTTSIALATTTLTSTQSVTSARLAVILT